MNRDSAEHEMRMNLAIKPDNIRQPDPEPTAAELAAPEER